MEPLGESEDGASAAAEPETQSRSGRARQWVAAHPMLVAAAISGVVGVVQAAWIWNHRSLGAFDPDESGYIASALRYQRSIDFAHPYAFVYAVGATGTGPIVPLLSLPLLIAGPRDPRTVMLVQPILMMLGSFFVAGIARRLAGPWTAIACGAAWAVLPTVVLATQSFWLGLGASTAMAGAMWALVTSDRCDNRRVWAFGFFVGCLLLTRTMTVAFVPSVVLAGLVMAGWDRRRLLRVAGSGLVAFVIAGPWWIVNWTSITGYLVGYGFGSRAALFGQGDVWDRLGFRLERTVYGVGRGVVVVALISVVAAGLWAVRSWRSDGWRPARVREATALGVAVVAGYAALASTSNSGVWFELPIIVILLPLVGAAIAHLPRPVAPMAVVPVVGMALVQMPSAWWWTAPSVTGVPVLAENWIDGAHYEDGFAQYDDRFATARRDERLDAASDWHRVNRDVASALKELTNGESEPVVTLSGNFQLLNSNTLTLEAELDSWGIRIQIPDTTVRRSERARHLTPVLVDTSGVVMRKCCDGRTTPRILVLLVHDHHLFTPDRDVDEFVAQARAEGWRLDRRIPMPGAGEARIMVHPDTAEMAVPPPSDRERSSG